MTQELNELTEKLEEVGGISSAQIELNRKRETELIKIRKEMDAAVLECDEAVGQMKRKHGEQVLEMSGQIDGLKKDRNRLEKEKQTMKGEFDLLKKDFEELEKVKLSAEKIVKGLEQQLAELSLKCEDLGRQLEDSSLAKARAVSEKNGLAAKVNDLETQVSTLVKLKGQLNVRIEEASRMNEDEVRAKNTLTQQLRNLSMELQATKVD